MSCQGSHISRGRSVLNARVTVGALCLVILSGCVTLPPGTSLDRPSYVGESFERNVWLAGVKVTDPSIDDSEARESLEASLTANLYRFLEKGKYFERVELLPGKSEPNDYVLHFQLERYEQVRSPHPAYAPAAVLTLGLYIVFGGAIYVDSSDLSGTLTIKLAAGETIGQVHSHIAEEHPVSLWSPEYALPSGMSARTALVEDLLRKGLVVAKASLGGNL